MRWHDPTGAAGQGSGSVKKIRYSLPRLFHCSSDNWLMFGISCVDKSIISELVEKGHFIKSGKIKMTMAERLEKKNMRRLKKE